MMKAWHIWEVVVAVRRKKERAKESIAAAVAAGVVKVFMNLLEFLFWFVLKRECGRKCSECAFGYPLQPRSVFVCVCG